MNADLWRLPATELARRYREGSLTPLAVAEATLARLESVNPRLNAVVARRDEAFLADAHAATERHARGTPLSPLDGVPLTVKDSLTTTGLPTSWGTPALHGHVFAGEELGVTRARAAGALVLGKTNVPEFAIEGFTDNPVFGATRNPWDPSRTPGGSSGGAVAAVAAGIAPLAIAQDGGGSIRRPASHAGLVGFKPSFGAVPRDAVLPSPLTRFEVVGPIARTVEDARLLFEAMRGPAIQDRSSLAAAQAASAARHDAPLRVLYVERFGDAPLDPQIAHSVSNAADAFAALGHRVERGALPLDLGLLSEAWPLVSQTGMAALFQAQPAWARQASAKYHEMAARGRAIPSTRLWNTLEQLKAFPREAAAMFERFDAVITPSAAALPWPVEDTHPDRIDGRAVGPRGHAVYTGWVNAAGLPALALPCAPSRERWPIGFQVVGPYGADDLLLALGAAYEQAQPWAHLWPSL